MATESGTCSGVSWLDVRPATALLALLVGLAACGPASAPVPPREPHARAAAGLAPDGCRAEVTPIGALPPAAPAWCQALGPAIDTAHHTAHGWVDGFDGGAVHARLPPAYRVWGDPRSRPTTVYRTQTFAHNGHWMVDVGGRGSPPGVYVESAADFGEGPHNGGSLLRPDAAFRFVDGRLVVEFDVSAGIRAYGDRVWPEVVVTTAPAPTGNETNGWYAAGLFGGAPAVGCSLPSDRLAECRVYDETKIIASLSAQLTAGAASVFGGTPSTPALAVAWRRCGPEDPDDRCRDRFRIVFERDALTLFVRGTKYMEHRGLPPSERLPDALLTSPVYVYFGSWAYLVEPGVARVHWGRLAVNP